MILDKIREANKFRKIQAEMQAKLEQIFASGRKGNVEVVVRGDRKIERILIDGVENKQLKDLINDLMKDVSKKSEKQLRGSLGDLGFPGL